MAIYVSRLIFCS